ncbi:uncharacterized protein J8A68_001602 [[Candida] subhashii]|uniref:UDENN domain-containing protein n=1 Tax=[Candida] subhashii TaxID=561895 RepID=A0A8J5QFT2_9ASCO|nr:uncharacterized protein J8A68_001602 [[Candida] subhashii]KAG7664844.1 hypothetical protein J8A68_001602 [[Candida] subhashii]
MPNINYIVTAEFHIDKGPSLVHQYPHELPGINNLYFLPELMLPDQIHKREEDFTLFMLYKNKSTKQFQYLYQEKVCEDKPYFLYTIVQNQKDENYKRGSQIKSLSIITKLPYFKNFKPLLLICLDLYFKTDSIEILKNLYESINAKNFIISKSIKSISIIKKLLITSILDLPIHDKIYNDSEFRKRALGIKMNETINEDLFIRKDLSFNSIISFNEMDIPVRIPLLDLPDTIGDYLNPTDLNFKPNAINILNARLGSNRLHNELTIYGLQTPPIIVLINAVLTGKRIMFVSYEESSGYIIDHILLLLKLITGGGILCGLLTNYNIFPIIDVSKIDLLNGCDSFIAGTINPFFKENDKFWDVLYDLDDNELFISTQLEGQWIDYKHSIISEDARFLSNLQLSLFSYNDDLTTIQLIFRRHINEILRILLSSKNFNTSLTPKDRDLILLLDGIGYYWSSDATKLLEVSCYQLVTKKFQDLLYQGKLVYNLLLPNLANELNLMVDIQHHLQSLNSIDKTKINEHEIWYNILKFLISGKSLEIFLLMTYLIPAVSSASISTTSHGGAMTVFDKNKGIELLLLNLFNQDDQIKSNVVMILQELQDNFVCGWCVNNFLKSNLVYDLALDDLLN